MKANSGVAIVGGGITGWLLGSALIHRGIACDIYDTDPCADSSSTRNQGWLHSGAFYVAMRDTATVARECRMGARWFTQFAPEAVDTTIASYYLFDDASEQQRVMADCQQFGIFARPLSDAQFTALTRQEPLLRGKPSRVFALEVHDFQINTTTILNKLVQAACPAGVRFQCISDWQSLQIVWNQSKWAISDHASNPSSTNEYGAIVLACGPHIPTWLRTLVPTHPHSFVVTKIPVLVVHGAISRSLLAMPGKVGAPQIVPFTDANGVAGATICLHRQDTKADASDDTLPQNVERDHARALQNMYRGIEPLVRNLSPQAQFYACHKLSLQTTSSSGISRAHTLLAFSPQFGNNDSLLALYPGKFTATPIAVIHAVHLLEKSLGLSRSRMIAPPSSGLAMPSASLQPYLQPGQLPPLHLTSDPRMRRLQIK